MAVPEGLWPSGWYFPMSFLLIILFINLCSQNNSYELFRGYQQGYLAYTKNCKKARNLLSVSMIRYKICIFPIVLITAKFHCFKYGPLQMDCVANLHKMAKIHWRTWNTKMENDIQAIHDKNILIGFLFRITK